MVAPSEHTSSHSPNAERLREALGWDRLPEMTPEQREAFDEANRRADEEARHFHGNADLEPGVREALP
jgi:hypothetical protein